MNSNPYKISEWNSSMPLTDYRTVYHGYVKSILIMNWCQKDPGIDLLGIGPLRASVYVPANKRLPASSHIQVSVHHDGD